jgi:hypothetical protein
VIWIPLAAWAGALVLASLVLGFLAYEVSWKASRLRADLARLQAMQGEALNLRDALLAAAERVSRSGIR